MPYNVQLPDGRNVQFPDSVPPEQAAQIIRQQLLTQAAPPAQPAPAQPQVQPGQPAEAAAMAAVGERGFGRLFSGLGTSIAERFKQLGYSYMVEKTDEAKKILKKDDAEAQQRVDELTQEYLAKLRASDERIRQATPEDLNVVEEGVRSGIESAIFQSPGLIASVAARSSLPNLALAGLSTRQQSYAEAREEGKTPEQASLYGNVDAIIEVGTEYFPSKFLTDAFGVKTLKGVKDELIKFAAGEIPGEQAATLLQSLNAYANGLDEELANAQSAGEAALIQGRRQVVTAIATLVGGGVQAGAATALGALRQEPPELTPRQSVAELDRQVADYQTRIAQIEAQLKIPGVYTQEESRKMIDEAKSFEKEIGILNDIRKDTVKTYGLTDLEKKEPATVTTTAAPPAGGTGTVVTPKDKPTELKGNVTLPTFETVPATEPFQGFNELEQRALDTIRLLGNETVKDQWNKILRSKFNIDAKGAGILLSKLKKADLITGRVEGLQSLKTVTPQPTVTPAETTTETTTAPAATTTTTAPAGTTTLPPIAATTTTDASAQTTTLPTPAATTTTVAPAGTTTLPPITTTTTAPAGTTTLPPIPQAQPIPEELYNNAINVVMSGQVSPTETKEDGTDFVLASVSTSALGRALNIGMEDANRVLDQMQAQGLVGEMMPNGVRPLTDQGLKTFKPTDSSAQIFEAGEGAPSIPLTDPASPIYQKGAEALKEAAMNRKDVNVPAIIKATGLERQQAVELMDAYQQNGVVSKADPKTRKRKYLLELPKRELRPRTTAQKAVAGTGATGTGTVVQKRGAAAAGTTKPPKSAGLGGVGAGVGTTDAGKGRVLPALAPEQRDQYQAAAQALLRAGAISTPDYNRVISDINLAANPVDDAGNPVTPPDLTETSKIVNAAAQRYQQIQAGTAKPIVEEKVELPDEVEERVGKKKERAAVSKQAKQFEKVTKQAAATTGVKAAQEEGAPKEIGGEAPPSVEREARVTGERQQLTPGMLSEASATPEQTTAALEETPEQTSKELSDDALISAINGKSLVQVLNLVVKTSDSPSYRMVADQLLRVLDYLVSSGLVKDFPIRVVKSLPGGAQGRATLYTQADPDRQPGVLNMGVQVEIGSSYADYKTLLHEIVHAVMLPLVQLGRAAKAIGTKNDLTDAVDEYEEVGDYIGRQLKHLANNLPKNNQMRALVQDMMSLNILKRDRNGRLTYEIDEIYTWALTDPSVQALLRLIPYRRERSAWSKFVNTVSNLLGFKSGADSALDQILSVTEKMANTADAVIELRRTPSKMIAMGRVDVGRLIQRGAKKFKAPPAKVRTTEEMYQESVDELDSVAGGRQGLLKRAKEFLTGTPYLKAARDLQNYRYVLKDIQNGLEMTSRLLRENVGTLGFNNFYDRMVVSTGLTKGIMVSRIMPRFEAIEVAAKAYGKKSKLPYKKVLAKLDKTLKALHIGERRRTKFMLFAPLDNTKKDFQITKPDGTTEQVSAAKLREYIWTLLHTNLKFQNDAQRQAWYKIIDNYRDQLMQLTDRNDPNNRLDVNGSSLADMMEGAEKKKPGTRSIRIEDPEYNVLGTYYQKEIDDLIQEYNSDPNKAEFDEIINAVRDVQEETVKLDEEANYWTQGVSNIKQFYGWKNYVPLTGKAQQKVSEEDDTLEFSSPRYSAEYKGEIAAGFKGAKSESQNALLATQIAATRAAMRVGLKDSRQALHNALSQGILDGKPKERIKFEDRAKGLEPLKYQGNRIFINYNADGSIDVWELTNRDQRNAIRREFEPEESNNIFLRAIDAMGTVTSGISQFFTRYNLAFGFKNFIRDMFTYSAVFARLGPKEMARYTANVAADVARLGLVKSGRISYLYNRGRFDDIEKLAAKDKRFYAPAWEFLKNGGESVFVQQFTKLSRLKNLVERYDVASANNKLKMGKEVIDAFFDTWASMFELTARVSAYRIRKEEILAKDPGLSDEAAQVSAASWTKEMQNFEVVGDKVRRISKLYYFFRPGSTGSVRALEVLRPMFIYDVNRLLGQLPDKIKKDPMALRKAEIQLRRDRYNSMLSTMAMLGLGYFIYMMAASMAGDDDLERNVVATDKKELWARSIRIPLSYFGLGEKDEFFQLPWGLGAGSFPAMGAQIAAYTQGHQTGKEFISNMMQIVAESYMPIQPVKFNPFDPTEGAKSVPKNLGIALIYPVTPSLPRSYLEYLINVNTLGQQIYRDQSNKYGDAYVDVERIPEIYNDAAKWFERVSDGAIDYKPEFYHYLVSNFVMGLGNLVADSYSLGLTLLGDKEFDPKRDTVFLSGFFARRPSPDAKEYERVKYDIENMDRELKKLDALAAADPTNVRNINYREKRPDIDGLIEVYRDNKVLVDKLREESNRIRAGQAGTYTTEERKRIVQSLNEDINLYKLQMVLYYQDYKKILEDSSN